MTAIRRLMLSTAVLGLCAGAVPAQDQKKEPPRPEQVIQILEKVRAQLAEKDLTPEQRQKLAEVLARTTRQLEGAVDREGEQRRAERDVERELRQQARDMDNARRDMERQRAQMEREMVARQKELEQARAKLEHELQRREVELRDVREHSERAQAEAREVAERARHEAEMVREQVMKEVERARAEAMEARDRARVEAETARRAAEEARRRARADAPASDAPAPKGLPGLGGLFEVKAAEKTDAPGGITVIRTKDGNVIHGRVLGLEDVTSAHHGAHEHADDDDDENEHAHGEHGNVPPGVTSSGGIAVVRRGEGEAPKILRFGGAKGGEPNVFTFEIEEHGDGKGETEDVEVYVVRPGDTLPKIAKVHLGDAGEWKAIVEANPQVDPRRMKVGEHIAVPAPHAGANVRFFPAPEAAAPPAPPAPVTEHHVHTHVHHHYSEAPKPPAAPKPAAAPTDRAPSVIGLGGGSGGAVRAVRAPRAVATPRAFAARVAAPSSDDVREMVEKLRAELRETRALVEDLRKELSEREAPKRRIN